MKKKNRNDSHHNVECVVEKERGGVGSGFSFKISKRNRKHKAHQLLHLNYFVRPFEQFDVRYKKPRGETSDKEYRREIQRSCNTTLPGDEKEITR